VCCKIAVFEAMSQHFNILAITHLQISVYCNGIAVDLQSSEQSHAPHGINSHLAVGVDVPALSDEPHGLTPLCLRSDDVVLARPT